MKRTRHTGEEPAPPARVDAEYFKWLFFHLVSYITTGMQDGYQNLRVSPIPSALRMMSLWVVVVVGLGLSLGAFGLVRSWETEQLEVEFQKAARDKIRLIDHAINHQESILFSVWAFCHSVHSRSGSSFQVFARQMLDSEPVFTALAFIPRIDRSPAGVAGRTFRWDDPSRPPVVERAPNGAWAPAAQRPEIFPVWFVEPMGLDELPRGWELGSEAELRAALDSARDTGQMTVAVRTASTGKNGPGFQIYFCIALYQEGAAPLQIEDRRRRLTGFVCGAFPMDRLLEHALGNYSASSLVLRIEDASRAGHRLIFSSGSLQPSDPSRLIPSAFHLTETRTIADHQWKIEYSSLPSSEHPVTDKLPWVVLGSGLLLTVLLGNHLIQRRRAEGILHSSETKYRIVAENTYAWEFWLDPSDRFVYSSPACLQITGYGADEFESDPGLLQRITHPSDWPSFVAYRQEARQRVPSASLVFRIIRRQGDIRWLGCMCTPVYAANGEFLGTRGSNHDITEHKQAEQSRLHYQEKLKALTLQLSAVEERERRRLAANVHDRISQVLAAAIMKLAVARQSTSDQARAGQLESLGKALEQLLDDSRSLTSELSPPTLYELGLEPAIDDLVLPMQERFGLEVRVQYDRQLKPLVDRQINGVLFRGTCELLANVARHAGTRDVVVSIGRTDRKVSVCVKDQGVGFNVGAFGSNHADGEGFGLFSIREHLLYLGGSLRIESAPGQGVAATMVIPLKSDEPLDSP